MGQGGYLWIVNATTTKLSLISENSYQMDSWSYSDIAANSQVRYIDEYISHNVHDDAGEANFRLDGTMTQFQLQVCWPENMYPMLQVDWSGTNTDDFTVFPPPLPLSRNIGKLGWIHDGDLCMIIQEKNTPILLPLAQNQSAMVLPSAKPPKTKPSVTPSAEVAREVLSSITGIPTANITPDHEAVIKMVEKMALSSALTSAPKTGLGTQWMAYYGDILGKLTLTEMTLPGTHDSGTYDPVSPLVYEWVRTQATSLREQLNLGIRVLDLRIGQNSPGDYIITHDIWRTHYSLSGALDNVKEFIRATNREIVILDFHRFGGPSFDFDLLKTQVKELLQGYYIPVRDGKGKTLNEIWQRPTSEQERVVIAWNSDTIDTSYMWPGVNQHWYSQADSIDALHSAIENDFSNPPPKDEMWSACVFVTPNALRNPYDNAKALCPTFETWFYGCAHWTLEANIISTDFFYQFNNSVQASICASILKAGSKN